MIDTAIILAGGTGTRLRPVLSDLPKPMAPVGKEPFLNYLLGYLIRQGIRRTILSTGYLGEKIREYYGGSFEGMSLSYAREAQPLGTGGGIRNAFNQLGAEPAFVLNGDTLFEVPLQDMAMAFERQKPDLMMAVKKMSEFDRYGTVIFDEKNQIKGFREKKKLETGWINGGIYLFSKKLFDQHPYPDKFSFEKDVLEARLSDLRIQAFPSEAYFIDIGIPGDYSKAQEELPMRKNAGWTLFLDRDGVINQRLPDDYVRSVEQFQWLDGVQKAISELTPLFERIVVVTNQQGIGKNLMTEKDLDRVHRHLAEGIRKAGGRIDGLFFCPHLAADNCNCRKPNTGMALHAREAFPKISFLRSVMVGDSVSDIEMGKRLGMRTVLIQGNEEGQKEGHRTPPDAECNSLLDAVREIRRIIGKK